MTDRWALLEAWYRQEMPRLFNYISYRVGSRVDAEELTAITCEKALDRLGQYDPERGTLTLWIYGIARNEIKMYFRRRANRPRLVSLNELPEIEARGTAPEASVEQRDLFAQIVGCLPQLNEREQELIALRYGAGLPNKQIGRMLNLRAGHVRVILHRALGKIRLLLAEEVLSDE